MSSIRERFEKDLAAVDWKALRIHVQRDALILVAAQLNLVDVATCVAADDSHIVATWIEDGLLKKPSVAQLASWELHLDKPFRMLIAAP
ncbi:MAG: DUF2288 domain-containing protein, partial [Deltaproteobacteria bacterium]|nr:DUF2288 domain-containing protein [Deltaproteobacteria bacterium]